MPHVLFWCCHLLASLACFVTCLTLIVTCCCRVNLPCQHLYHIILLYHHTCHINNAISSYYVTSPTMCQVLFFPFVLPHVSISTIHVATCSPAALPHGTPCQHFAYWAKTSKCHNFFIWRLFDSVHGALEISQWGLWHDFIYIRIRDQFFLVFRDPPGSHIHMPFSPLQKTSTN